MRTLAVLPNWQESPADNFAAAFPSTGMVGINLDQRSFTQLRDCIIPWDGGASGELAWAGKIGRDIYLTGRNVLWTVPFPGARQMEAVNRGDYDDLYVAIAQQIHQAAVQGKWKGELWLRLFHEGNLEGNTENRAYDLTGKGNADLHKRCYRRIAGIMRNTLTYMGRQAKFAWSPSVERTVICDWRVMWPGKTCVDAITPDLYMCTGFGQSPGVYTGDWFRKPLLELRAFAEEKALPFGLGEVGVNDDAFASDIDMALTDVKACKSGWLFVQWWNDWQVTDCRVTEGRLPAIAAILRKHFP